MSKIVLKKKLPKNRDVKNLKKKEKWEYWKIEEKDQQIQNVVKFGRKTKKNSESPENGWKNSESWKIEGKIKIKIWFIRKQQQNVVKLKEKKIENCEKVSKRKTQLKIQRKNEKWENPTKFIKLRIIDEILQKSPNCWKLQKKNYQNKNQNI